MKGTGMEKAKTLHELLRQWPSATPSAGFEEHVWRRIRAGEAPAARQVWWSAPASGWLRVAALVAALATGWLVAASVGTRAPQAPGAGLSLDRAGTLTGDYLRLVRSE